MSAPLVVIGTGLAGYNLVKEFRKQDQDTPVIMITSDDGNSYSKPMLSTGFSKNKDADSLTMADVGKMAEQLKAEIRTHQNVTAIETKSKIIELGSDSLVYGKLVLALGAEPIVIDMPGSELLHHINDLMDYRHFHKSAQDKKRILIMGSGLVGCEYAHDMAASGYDVIMVAPDEQPLTRLVPKPCGSALVPALQALGVELKMGRSVVSLCESPSGVEVKLDDGSTILVDMALSAVGLAPRSLLASSAGIDCEKGIKVDRTLETSVKDVYALGDCAQVDGLNLLYVLPLMNCARALGKTLSGDLTEVKYPVMPVQVKTPSLPIIACPPSNSSEGEWEIEGEGSHIKALFRNKNGQLLGYALTGERVAEKITLNKELPVMLA